MKNGTIFYGSKKVIPSQKPGEKVDLLTNRRLKLSVWANMLSDYHILSLEKCNGQKASSKRKKYFNDSSQNPWKMESLYYVREKKKKELYLSHWTRIIPLRTSLSISNLHSNSPVSRSSYYAMEYCCLSSKYSLWYSTFKFALLDFTPLHTAIEHFLICIPI